MRRREFCGSVVGSCLLATATTAAAHHDKHKQVRSVFILVHGAWHGGWCWKKVAPLLRAAGHVVLTPTLTGLGERAHLLHSEIDLETHIQDLVQTIQYEDLDGIVLVGHSYAGMVIAGAGAVVRDRLRHLVYVDAFLPDNGKALSDYAPVPPTREDGWRIPPIGRPEAFDVTDAHDVAWMAPRLGDQPVRTFTQPVRLARSLRKIPATYIQCTAAPFFSAAAERARQRNFEYRELFSGGHDVMITQPQALASVLLEASTRKCG